MQVSLRETQAESVRQEGLIGRLDALVTFNGKNIGVIVKYAFSAIFGTQRIESAFAILGSDESHKLDGVILVMYGIHPRSLELASGHHRFALVEWQSKNGNDVLLSAFEMLTDQEHICSLNIVRPLWVERSRVEEDLGRLSSFHHRCPRSDFPVCST